jgi:hypothetical protein
VIPADLLRELPLASAVLLDHALREGAKLVPKPGGYGCPVDWDRGYFQLTDVPERLWPELEAAGGTQALRRDDWWMVTFCPRERGAP